MPIEVQTAGGSISKLVSGYPNLFIQEIDGTDPLESYEAVQRAAAYCRERQGPALIHAHVIRPYSHSLSDDEKLYRSSEERDAESVRALLHRRLRPSRVDDGLLAQAADPPACD